jgi:hypothetical protein
MKRARLIAVAVMALIGVATGAMWQARKRGGAALVTAPDVRAPEGARVRVQVLNGTKTRGLARRATMVLRDRGFDVLETGTEREPRDTTIVYDLTGHPDWAQRVAKIFAPARVTTQIDSSRYLDIAVVLGSTWRPPSQPFYP